MIEKRKRDFEIRLLKDEIKQRKQYPLGVPPGPAPEQLRERRERDAAKAASDAKFELERQQKEFNSPMMVCLREVKANRAIDPDYYRKQREAAWSKMQPRQRRMPEGFIKKVVAATELAEKAGRPFPERLSLKIMQDIRQGKL